MRPAPLIGGNADASSQMAWESHTPRLAAELADAGVTVNVLDTGIVDTAIYSWIMSQPPELIGAWVRDLFVGFRERGVLITPGRSATALNSQLAGIGTGSFGMSTTDPDTPDGRHLTRKGQATRQRIIAAAARLLEERGVAGVSVGDVQQAASVSAGQVYHYFPGKQALIRTVVRHRFRVTMDAQRPRLDHLDNLGALCAWRDLLVETQSSEPHDRRAPRVEHHGW